jgi:hypothetical protein
MNEVRSISNHCGRALATNLALSIVLLSAIAPLGCRPGRTAQEDPNADVVAELTNFRAPDSAEDKDLLGLGVVERFKDGTERSEEYPVYVHAGSTRVVRPGIIPVYLRDEGQQKDESRWEEYVRGDKIDKWSMGHTGGRYYLDTLPPVYVSLPDPNKVDVLVYLYDRRGNKSSLVEPTNRLNVHNPDDDVPHLVGIRRVQRRGR